MKRRICVCIGKEKLQDCLDGARAVSGRADVIEIRLDHMADPQVFPFLQEITTPLLFTNRAEWEGGNFKGDEEARIALLREAVVGGASFIDLELLAPSRSWKTLRSEVALSDTRLIASWHNFECTPTADELNDKLSTMRDSGAHIGKIITTANSFQDVLRVLILQETALQMDFPLIAFCMGAVGVISRVATVDLGGYMTYCSPDDGGGTAPGQISLADITDIYDLIRR